MVEFCRSTALPVHDTVQLHKNMQTLWKSLASFFVSIPFLIAFFLFKTFLNDSLKNTDTKKCSTVDDDATIEATTEEGNIRATVYVCCFYLQLKVDIMLSIRLILIEYFTVDPAGD